MSKAKMTLIGLENYCQGAGESLFTGLVLPSGINKDDVVNTILMRSGEFEILYSDPVFLKASISLWGRNWYATFARWLETLTEEYNPLHNYDRTETITERIDEDTQTKNNGTGTSTGRTTANDSSNSKVEVDNTDTTSVSAYNTSSFDNSDKSVLDGETKTNQSSQSTGTSNESNTISNQGTENKDIVRSHQARMFGNIGVTTSATMATEELTLRGNFVLNKMIADTFIKEFCIMVY